MGLVQTGGIRTELGLDNYFLSWLLGLSISLDTRTELGLGYFALKGSRLKTLGFYELKCDLLGHKINSNTIFFASKNFNPVFLPNFFCQLFR